MGRQHRPPHPAQPALLAWALLSLEVAFWGGFDLPFGLVAGAIRTVLLLNARRGDRPAGAANAG